MSENVFHFLLFSTCVLLFFVLLNQYYLSIEREQYCRDTGFFGQEEKTVLNQKIIVLDKELVSCQKSITKNLQAHDKNYSKFATIINAVFYTEKIWRDYNTFNYDLNVCERFC